MASHATTSNAAPAFQARQQRLLPTGIGSKRPYLASIVPRAFHTSGASIFSMQA